MSVLPPDPVFVLRHPDMDSVNSLAFHQDQRLLAGTLKGNVFLWDLQTNRCRLQFDAGSEPLTSMHHTEDHLITQEKGGALKSWSVSNAGYVMENRTETNHDAFCRTDYSSDHGMLAYPRSSNTIGVVNTKDWQNQTLLVPDEDLKVGQLACVKMLNCGGRDLIVAGYESGDFLTWDLRSEKVLNAAHFDVGGAMCVDFDVFTNRGVVGGTEDKLTAVTFQRTTMELTPIQEIHIKNPGVNCIRIRNDHKVFTTGGWDGRIRIFSWKSLRPLAVLTEHKTGGILDVAYSNGKVLSWNSPIMAAAGQDGQISLWDLYN